MNAETDCVAKELAQSVRRGIIAIDGPAGAGKTTFAHHLVKQFELQGKSSVLIQTDDFASWEQPVAWWNTFTRDVIKPFQCARDIEYRPLVWKDGIPELGEMVWRRWQPLLIIEGVSSARRRVFKELTAALWISGGTETERLARVVARDGEGQRENFRQWQCFENSWFAVDHTAARCRIIN